MPHFILEAHVQLGISSFVEITPSLSSGYASYAVKVIKVNKYSYDIFRNFMPRNMTGLVGTLGS